MVEVTKIKVGKRELNQLATCGVPTTILLNPDRTTDRLVQKGLLRVGDVSKAVCITPDGLRALASAIESGALQDGLDLARQQREKAH